MPSPSPVQESDDVSIDDERSSSPSPEDEDDTENEEEHDMDPSVRPTSLARKGSFDAGSLFAATATGAGASNASLG